MARIDPSISENMDSLLSNILPQITLGILLLVRILQLENQISFWTKVKIIVFWIIAIVICKLLMMCFGTKIQTCFTSSGWFRRLLGDNEVDEDGDHLLGDKNRDNDETSKGRKKDEGLKTEQKYKIKYNELRNIRGKDYAQSNPITSRV